MSHCNSNIIKFSSLVPSKYTAKISALHFSPSNVFIGKQGVTGVPCKVLEKDGLFSFMKPTFFLHLLTCLYIGHDSVLHIQSFSPPQQRLLLWLPLTLVTASALPWSVLPQTLCWQEPIKEPGKCQRVVKTVAQQYLPNSSLWYRFCPGLTSSQICMRGHMTPISVSHTGLLGPAPSDTNCSSSLATSP